MYIYMTIVFRVFAQYNCNYMLISEQIIIFSEVIITIGKKLDSVHGKCKTKAHTLYIYTRTEKKSINTL